MKVIYASCARWNSNITFLYVTLDSAQTVRVGQTVRVPLMDGSVAHMQVSAIRLLGHLETPVDQAGPGAQCELELHGLPFRAVRTIPA